MSLLQHDTELIKGLSLPEGMDLDHETKVEFVNQQIIGIQQQMWRSRVDAMLNHGLKTADAKEAAAVAGKIAEHEADVKRFCEALALLAQLKADLTS